jgi:CRP/FNR family cyclic AMP-dependent transcriptional regulator
MLLNTADLQRPAATPAWLHDFSHGMTDPWSASSTYVTLPLGTVLFREGEPLRCVSALCSGRVKLSRASPQGKTFLVRVARPGDILGVSAALSGLPHEITAQALEPIELKLTPRSDFLRLLREDPEIGCRVAESLSKEYRSVLNGAYRLALSDSIASRVAHLLLELALDTPSELRSQPEIDIALRHEDIASMLGSSRESVTRTLNHFKRREIIAVRGTRITLLRIRALQLML